MLFSNLSSLIFHFLNFLSRLKITDSRSPVMMTGQIFFSLDKPRFWPVKLMNNIIIIFLPMEYRITLAVDRCTALSFRFLPASWWKIHSHVVEFLSAIFARFMSVYIYLQYHRTAVSEVSKVRPISAYRWNLILFVAWHVIKSLVHKEETSLNISGKEVDLTRNLFHKRRICRARLSEKHLGANWPPSFHFWSPEQVF